MLRRYWQEKPPVGPRVASGLSLADGLVECWPCNEVGGRLLNGALRHSPGVFNSTVSWGHWGNRGRALLFGGGYVDFGVWDPFKFGLTDFSVSLWFSTGTTNVASLFGTVGADGTKGWGFWKAGASINLTVTATDGSGQYDTALTYADSKPHHIVYSVRRGQSTSVFFDGVRVNTFTITQTGSFAHTNPLRLGSFPAGTPFAFDGYLDSPTLWNRSLLPTEVFELYSRPWSVIQPPRRRSFAASVGGAALTKSLSETLSLTDTRALDFGKLVTQALTLTDAESLAASKLLGESLSLADARTLGAGKSLAETLALSDARILGLAKALAESLALTEALDAIILGNELTLELAESLTLTDTRLLAAAKALAEPLVLSDARALGLAKQIAETLNLSDTAAAVILTAALILTTRSARGDLTSRTARGDGSTKSGGIA